MSYADKYLDDLQSGKGLRIAKKLDTAKLIFYISVLFIVILLVWNFISGFKGFQLYTLIPFVICAIGAKIIQNNAAEYLRYGAVRRKPEPPKQFEKRKISILGIGTGGTLLLSNLKYLDPNVLKYLNLVGINDNRLTRNLFDGYVQLPYKQTHDFVLPEAPLQKYIADSDMVFAIANYLEPTCRYLLPLIGDFVRKQNQMLKLFVYLPFIDIPRAESTEIIANYEQLVERFEQSLQYYHPLGLMHVIKEKDPFKFKEKMEELLLRDILQAVDLSMKTSSPSQQKKDMDNLRDTLNRNQ